MSSVFLYSLLCSVLLYSRLYSVSVSTWPLHVLVLVKEQMFGMILLEIITENGYFKWPLSFTPGYSLSMRVEMKNRIQLFYNLYSFIKLVLLVLLYFYTYILYDIFNKKYLILHIEYLLGYTKWTF